MGYQFFMKFILLLVGFSTKFTQKVTTSKGIPMPELFCKSCKSVTPHKSLMRRSQEAPSSFTQKFTQFFSHVAKGNHYYEMEPAYFCRDCNCQNMMQEPQVSTVSSATQAGALQ